MKKVSALLFSALFALCASPLFAEDSSPRITGGVLVAGVEMSTLVLNLSAPAPSDGQVWFMDWPDGPAEITLVGGKGRRVEAVLNCDNENGFLAENAKKLVFDGCNVATVTSNGSEIEMNKEHVLQGLTMRVPAPLRISVGEEYETYLETNVPVSIVRGGVFFERGRNFLSAKMYANDAGTVLEAVVDSMSRVPGNLEEWQSQFSECLGDGGQSPCGTSAAGGRATCGYGELCEVKFSGLRTGAFAQDGVYEIAWRYSSENVSDEHLESWKGVLLQDGADFALGDCVFEGNGENDAHYCGFTAAHLAGGQWFVVPKHSPAATIGDFRFNDAEFSSDEILAQQAWNKYGNVVRLGRMSLTGSPGADGYRIDLLRDTQSPVISASYFGSQPLDPGSEYTFYLLVADSARQDDGINAQYLLKKDFKTGGPELPQLTSFDFPDSVFTGEIPLSFSGSGEVAWSFLTTERFERFLRGCEEEFGAECSDYLGDDEISGTLHSGRIEGKGIRIDVPEGESLLEWTGNEMQHVELLRGMDLVLVFYAKSGSGENATLSGPRFVPFAYADNYKLRFAIDFEAERTKEMIEPPYGWTTDSSLSRNSIVRPEEADDLPLTPGKNVYIVRDVNASTPALAWTIEVPARPKARTISLPTNDLQYVYLTDTLEWDFEQICRIDYLDISCEESDEPETEREESWMTFGDFAATPILLSRSTPSLRYRVCAKTDTSFRSEIGSVEFKEDGPEFAPYAELSGQFVRLNATKNFSGNLDKALIALVTDDSDEDVVGPYPMTRYDAGLLSPGKHRATVALYLPREDAWFFQEGDVEPPPADDEPITEDEEGEGIERLRIATPDDYVLVAIDSAEIDVPDLASVVWAPDTALSPWAMTGLGGDVSDLSEAGLADADVLGWSETEEWDERWAKYRALDRVFAGEGVWIWAEDTVKFTRPYVGSDGTGDDYVSVRLRSRDFGWNLLANPYPFGIPASMAGDAQLYAWDREAGDYVEIPRNGVVAPFQAFWIHAEENATLDIPGRAMFESDVVDEPASAEPADLMRVSLRAGAYRDANNYVGVGDSARSRGEFPLAMGAGVTLTSLRDGSGWESDVRGADDVLHWSFAVSSRVSGLARGELALENRGALESLGYRLWTSQNGKLSEVRGDAPVAVALPASGSRVELYAARSKDLLEKELSRGSSGWKVRSSWDRAQGRADFRFSLDEPADLELRLLDASGRPIASQSASFGAGAQNWSWSASAPPASAVFWSISGGNLRAEGSF